MLFCDFCFTFFGRWPYPRRNGVVLACDGCHKLIDSGDKSGLINRCFAMIQDHQVLGAEDTFDVLVALRTDQTEFWSTLGLGISERPEFAPGRCCAVAVQSGGAFHAGTCCYAQAS